MKLAVALLAVYLAWGSSYLAILVGVRDAPALLFAASRLLLASPLLLLLALLFGDRPPKDRSSWRALLVGALLIPVASGGLVAWALQSAASGEAAIIIASAALWMAWFGSWGRKGDAVSLPLVASLMLGLAGVALIMSGALRGDERSSPAAYLALMLASITLAAGSVYQKRHRVTCGVMMNAGLQTAAAGLMLLTVALVLGESVGAWYESQHAWWALAYLVIVGSVMGYSALYWLIRVTSPAMLGSYLYVSPAVAIALGWLFLDERLSVLQWGGAGLILASVMAVSLLTRRPTIPADSSAEMAGAWSPPPDQKSNKSSSASSVS